MLRLTSKFYSPPVSIWPQDSIYFIRNKTSNVFLKYYISITSNSLTYLNFLRYQTSLPSVFFLTGPTNRNKWEKQSLCHPDYKVSASLLDKLFLSPKMKYHKMELAVANLI